MLKFLCLTIASLLSLTMAASPASARPQPVNPAVWQLGKAMAIYLPPCHLPIAPHYAPQFKSIPWHLCLTGDAGVGMAGLRSRQDPPERRRFSQLRAGAGLHLQRMHAIHGHAYVRQDEGQPRAAIDWLVYRYGKPTLDRWQLQLGRQKMPFGLDSSVLNAYGYAWQANEFWPDKSSGGVITFDNLVDFSVEVGASEHSKGLRLLYDISTWHGTRLIASYQDDGPQRRRYGFALGNWGDDGGFASFEWVRLSEKDTNDFDQLFRLAFRGAKQGRRQTYFQYEDLRLRQRLAILGQHYYVHTQVNLDTGLIYRRNIVSNDITWGLLAGIGAKL